MEPKKGKQKTDYTLKILVLGDSAVGKTCILMQFDSDGKATDAFSQSHVPTIGTSQP